MHFCGNTLQDIALFGKAESCGTIEQESFDNTCSTGEHKEGFNKGNCCKDQKFSFLGISSSYEFTNVLPLSIVQDLGFLFFYEIKSLKGFSYFQKSNFTFDLYEPPVTFRNLLTLFDTFLI